MRFSLIILIIFLPLVFFAQNDQKWPPELTEVWEPIPEVVTPGTSVNTAPSDAIVLFDGTNTDEWVSVQSKEKIGWKIEDGAMTVVKGTGGIQTKREFGDVQLHIEWRTPAEVEGDGQGRGNSGVFLQSTYEVQVLDNYNNRTYSNGQAGSIYKQSMPLVNACRPPGEWQTYDIIFMAPQFSNGQVIRPATITVFHNGVLVQNHYELKGNTPYIGLPKYKAHGKLPLMLQDHSNPVSYRNIWVREL